MQARLEALAQERPPAQFFEMVQLPAITAEGGECFFASSTGRQDVLQCSTRDYAAWRDSARFRKTPPENEPAAPLSKVETPACSTIEALANFLGVPKSKTAKALMFTRADDGKFVFVVVRGDMQLSEAKLRRCIGEFRPATQEEIIAAGATPGYASPIGLKEALVIVDDLIPDSPNLVGGANEPGFHFMNTNLGRDYAASQVEDLALAQPGDACPQCGRPMTLLRAELLANEKGYYLENVMYALAETHHDGKGLVLPAAAAPFEVYLMHVPGKELDTKRRAEELYAAWQRAGVAVLFDDRDERAGVKFADADLIGCPIRATVGERGMKDGMVELKPRKSADIQLVPFDNALSKIQSAIDTPS